MQITRRNILALPLAGLHWSRRGNGRGVQPSRLRTMRSLHWKRRHNTPAVNVGAHRLAGLILEIINYENGGKS